MGIEVKNSCFKQLLLAGVTTAGMAFGIADAQAAFIGATPATNDIFGIREGWFDADLFLNAGGNVNATLELLGYEAGANNTFNINGGATEYNIQGFANFFPAGTNLMNVVLSPGLLNFLFTTTVTGPGSVANGANLSPVTDLPNFFVTFGAQGDSTVNGSTADSGTVVLVALDDSGAGPDDNHDDLIVRLTVASGTLTINPVPEPATIALFGMGLLGLSLASRRRKA